MLYHGAKNRRLEPLGEYNKQSNNGPNTIYAD